MSNIFQMKQNVTYADMEHYEKEKLMQESKTQEHFARMELSSEKLMERYQPRSFSEEEQKPEVLQDMPQQSADEKESKFKKRKKYELQSGAEELHKTYQAEKREQGYQDRIAKRSREMIPTAQAQEIFEEPILADQLTPDHIMNNFAEIRKRLDDWKEHMEVYDAKYAARHGLSRERELRMQQMEKMYQDSEKAFQTAIRALGYRYDPSAKSGRQFSDDLTEEEKAAALKENRLLRSGIKQAADDMAANVAAELLREEKGRRRDTFASGQKRTAKLTEINALLIAHQDKYAENRKSVELLCQELDQLLALLEATERDSRDIDSILEDRIDYEGKTKAYLEERRKEMQNKERILQGRAECIEKGLKYVLTESALTQKEMLTLREFLPEEFEQNTQSAEDKAAYYAHVYREKELLQKRQAKDQKEQTKEELAKTAKPLLLPQLERLRAFDTKELESCTDEELLTYNAELQELYFSSMQIADIGKYRDADDAGERSIKDAFCGEKKEEFDLKCAIIQSYAMKARGIAMVKAYEQGRLTENCFTKGELSGMHTRFHVGEKAPLTMDHMLIAAKEMLEKASVLQEASYNRYFRSEHGMARYVKRPERVDIRHPAYKKALDDMKKAGRAALLLPENAPMDSSEILQYHKYCREQKGKLEQKLAQLNAEANGGEAGEIEETKEQREIRAQIAILQEHMQLLQAEHALRKTHYQRAGDPYSLLEEPIFRSYDSVESLPAFQNMSDEAFRQMCMQLSAGALEQDAAEPEKTAQYYKENMQGLQTYKQHLSQHYEMLEERFHHRLPSTEYIIEHREELERWFADVQVNTLVVEKMSDLLDLTKPEDQRLYHLVNVYNSMGGYICGIGSRISNDGEDYYTAVEMLTITMRQAKSSFDYLDGKWDMQSEEKHQLVLDRFRQLELEPAQLLTADQAEQSAYLEHVRELRDYIAQHDGDGTMAMKQMKGWLRLAQMRIQLLAKRENPYADEVSYEMLYAQKKAKTLIGDATFAELAKRLSLLQLTEEMLTEEYMTSHADELLISFEAMDAYQAMLKQTPALEETIPAAQKLAWEKSQSIYGRYRDYVTAFMRSRCVDIQKGEYLNQETYLAEKKPLRGKLSKEKTYFEDMLGSFGRYAQQVQALSAKVDRLSALDKEIRGGISRQLTEAEAWLKDLTAYLTKPLVLEPEDFFDATIMTLMSMFGYIEKDLHAAILTLTEADSTAAKELSADIENIFDTFHIVRAHIPGCAQQLRKDTLHTENGQALTLQDIVLSAQGVMILTLNGEEQQVGAAASDVLRLEEGEKVFFFKEDEILQDFLTTLKEQILALGDAELENKLLALLEKVKTDDEVRDQLTILLTAVELIMPDGQLNENALAQVNAILALDVRGYIENAENQEKWKNFAKAFKKRFTVEAAITDVGYQLDEGADMTARNFASERVAELFGLKDLITKNHEAVLVTRDGAQKKGFAMEMAEGVSVGTLRQLASDIKYTIIVPGEAQRQLLNLQILDNIIGQVDRHTGNVFVSYHRDDERKQLIIEKVTGIDNDFAFGASEKIGGYNTSSILAQKKKAPAKKGEAAVIEHSYLLGVIDKDMYESLRTVTPELLAVNLEGIIEPPYIEAVKKRYETVRSSILAAVNADQGIVKAKDEWNEDTRKQTLRYKGESLLIQRLLEWQKDQW